MTRSRILTGLSALAALMASISAAAGLFTTGGSPFTFTTLRGEQVEMWGQGIYRYDTAFKAPIMRGTDAVTLLVVVPLLLFAVYLYNKGSLRGRLLLAAMLSVSTYTSISVAFGAAYNDLLLVYTAWFSSSLFGAILAITGVNAQQLAEQIGERAPRRGMAVFMFIAGATVLVWLADIIGSLVSGSVPGQLGAYSTEVTYVLDLAIIFPLAYLTGVLLLRRAPIAYLLAAILMVANSSVGLAVLMQTIMQMAQGIFLTPGQYIGYVGTFVVMGTIAIYFIARLFRAIQEPSARPAAQASPARGAKAPAVRPVAKKRGAR